MPRGSRSVPVGWARGVQSGVGRLAEPPRRHLLQLLQSCGHWRGRVEHQLCVPTHPPRGRELLHERGVAGDDLDRVDDNERAVFVTPRLAPHVMAQHLGVHQEAAKVLRVSDVQFKVVCEGGGRDGQVVMGGVSADERPDKGVLHVRHQARLAPPAAFQEALGTRAGDHMPEGVPRKQVSAAQHVWRVHAAVEDGDVVVVVELVLQPQAAQVPVARLRLARIGVRPGQAAKPQPGHELVDAYEGVVV
mmetsp:Transcript_25467/g.82285  ORF Transcript_25467/g.82285 Transcript_25467/m.82285 type:complete len:247 (-) Transcript_25467:366-1106(-)|eukprot:scaffold24754_cov135-Isochrysis_galbana.AAC.4